MMHMVLYIRNPMSRYTQDMGLHCDGMDYVLPICLGRVMRASGITGPHLFTWNRWFCLDRDH
jgi:hypothetical protein